MTEPLETAELLAFTKTVDSKSLSRAAAELGVPRATIGRRLARLEERLGARLLRRTTRSLALTDAGEALYRHARLVLDAVEYAERSVRRSDGAVRGALRVSVPPVQDASFSAMLTEFASTHPEVRVQLHVSTAHVDLKRDGYDVAIRASSALEPGLVARTLRRDPIVAVASPAYLEAHGTPKTVRDLKHHRCVMGFARGELPETHWPLARGGRIAVTGTFFSNDLQKLHAAALAGLGIAVLPGVVMYESVARGELVHVLAGIIEAEARISVVYLEREFVPPQVRAFIDTVVAWADKADFGRLPPSCEGHKVARANAKKPARKRTSVGAMTRKR